MNKKIILFFILFILIHILQFVFVKNKLFNYIFLLTVPMFLIFIIIFKNKLNKKIEIQKNIEKNNLIYLEKINLEINNLKNEINLIEENNNNLENEILDLKNNLNLKINLEKEKIKNNYFHKIEKNKINDLLQLENIKFELENLQNKINDKKIKLHTLDLDQKNIEPKLNNLSKIEEELVNHLKIFLR